MKKGVKKEGKKEKKKLLYIYNISIYIHTIIIKMKKMRKDRNIKRL